MASFDEETAKKILNQVEFYFSDSNLPRDHFLHKSVTQSKDGMVSLALICSFSRMRNHLGLGNVKREDIPERILEGVSKILRKSIFLKVSDDGKNVGRITELSKPEEVMEQVNIRTIAASPFQYDVKIENVESFLVQYGKVNSVRLPRLVADKRCFCGTALIEFSTDVDAEEVLKQNLVYAGADLVLKSKKEFDSERGKMMKETEKSCSSMGSSHKDNPNMRSDHRKGLLVAFSLKRRSVGEKVNKKGKPENRKQKVKGNKGNSKKIEETITKEGEEKISEDFICQPGDESHEDVCQESEEKASGAHESTSLVQKENDVISCEDLKDVFQRFGVVKHVDYTLGAESGYICFEKPEAAIKARAAAAFIEESGLIVKNTFFISLEAVNGEVEKEYWKSFHDNQEGCQESRAGRGGKRKFNTDGGRFKG